MIKVIVCDGDGTLQMPNPSDDMRKLISSLPELGIKLAVASNNRRSSIINSFNAANLALPEIIVTPSDVNGARKPSAEFIYKIRNLAKVELNEIAYIGDDDDTDTFCAINAGVLPLTARYSTANKSREYGLFISNPANLEGYIRTFGKQDAPYFGWLYQNPSIGVDIRALLGDQGKLKPILLSVLKEQKDQLIGTRKMSATVLFFLYFMNQLYLSGVAAQVDIATVYPGHTAGRFNQVLSAYLSRISKMFRRDRFIQDLLIRHTTAPKQQYQGDNRDIYNQFSTINVNGEYKAKIQNKTILVLDDFTTAGQSLETARHMLLQAGAKSVICLAIAKFRQIHTVAQITKSWNPFEPCTLTKEDIYIDVNYGASNSQADQYFHNNIWEYYSR